MSFLQIKLIHKCYGVGGCLGVKGAWGWTFPNNSQVGGRGGIKLISLGTFTLTLKFRGGGKSVFSII